MTQPAGAGEFSVGLDVGGTNVRGIAVRASGPIGEFVRQDRPPSAEGMLQAMVDTVLEIEQDLEAKARAVGVGIAGLVDRSGMVGTSPNIPELHNFALRDRLEQSLSIPAVVDNDATAAAWAEFTCGAGVESTDMVLIGLGTGIGGGIVSNGQVVRGASGLAGEIGHMVMVPNGVACPCGRNGCWERYGSGSALGELLANAVSSGQLDAGGRDEVRGTDLIDMVANGVAGASELLTKFAHSVAAGLANVIVVLDPALVVLGGGLVADMGDPLLNEIRSQYLQIMVDHEHRTATSIVLAHMGDEAGAVGAGLLALAP